MNNMISERKITAVDGSGLQVRTLYKTTFLVTEDPWDFIMDLTILKKIDIRAYYESDAFVGFTIVYPRHPFYWLWYIAIREDIRGQGYGQSVLSELLEKHKGKTVILDIESPEQVCNNMEIRHRRHAFYLHNGFRDTEVGHSYKGIDYTFMVNGEVAFTRQDYNDIIKDFNWLSYITVKMKIGKIVMKEKAEAVLNYLNLITH